MKPSIVMIQTQLTPRGIKDKNVLSAMENVPRHLFVSSDMIDQAYDDRALSIGENQTISQPYMVAKMTELLNLNSDCLVLEIGTGSGYQAAILAQIAKKVYTIERLPSLAKEAEKRFIELGYNNIYTKVSDGTLGWGEKLLFDRIIITAAAPKIPDVLIEQLKDKGIIVAPVGERFTQTLIILTKDGETLKSEYQTPCVFVPLIGKYGWDG
jgi:protein-L-isoaspartate(D-aspartate) O-methyltransferase